jgi:transcriptional regulator with XRE-family HTH domain
LPRRVYDPGMEQMTLKARAVNRDLTQQDIADRLGVPVGSVNLWLNRRRAVPDRHKRALAEMLGTTVDDLLLEG